MKQQYARQARPETIEEVFQNPACRPSPGRYNGIRFAVADRAGS